MHVAVASTGPAADAATFAAQLQLKLLIIHCKEDMCCAISNLPQMNKVTVYGGDQ